MAQSRMKEYLVKWISNPILFTSRFQIWKSGVEVNTIPGMTEESILPQMAADYGMSLTTLFGIALDNIFMTKW